jgi:predicted nucleic acid-binding protein
MAGIYVDTSALGRVLLGEPDAELIREMLAQYDPWWSSALLLVELRRLARREDLEQDGEELLSLVSTQRLDLPALRRSSNLNPVDIRTLDAIHLDAAIQLNKRGAVDAVLTFDHQLQAGCAHHGLAVEAPVTS